MESFCGARPTTSERLEALPATLLIDREGKIVFMHSGLVGKDVYEHEIKALLAVQSPR